MFSCFRMFKTKSQEPEPIPMIEPPRPEPSNLQIHQLQCKINKLEEELQAAIRGKREIEEEMTECLNEAIERMSTELTESVSQIYEENMDEARKEADKYEKRADELEKKLMELQGTEAQESSMPTCQICRFEFSDNPDRTPRVLSCGHTVCEHCLQHIYCNSEVEENTLKCPFDRKMTVLDMFGPIGLPINFTVLEMVGGLK